MQRGDDWAQTARVTNNRTDTTTRVTRTDDGAAVTRRSDDGFVGRTSDGDVYAGRDGNVYRQGDDGWQKREDGGWSSVDSPERAGDQQRAQTATQNAQPERQRQTDQATVGQLERDRSSRASGTTRTQGYKPLSAGGIPAQFGWRLSLRWALARWRPAPFGGQRRYVTGAPTEPRH